MDLPGFRFYPTEEELVGFYLKKRIQGSHPMNFDIIIPTLDLYRYDPCELPSLAHDVEERQWFFFVPRDHKNSSGRPNRLTKSGYWKATGSDRAIRNELLQCIGLKKILVFYKGKAPYGQKTDWIMNEYRLPDLRSSSVKVRDIVLCRIYRKAASQRSMELQAKPDHVVKEETAVSGDEYEDTSYSTTLNNGGQLSNPMTEIEVSSLYYQKRERVCSSDQSKTNNGDSLYECLEPIMLSEETRVLKNPKACKTALLELPNMSLNCPLSQPIATPPALLSTPPPFQPSLI